jgi:hypothetical protein
METISQSAAILPLLSASEIARATEYLSQTHDDLLAEVADLDDAQWHFKPAPGRWSIAENLEHIVLIESRVHAIVCGMADAPPAEPDRKNSEIDELIVSQVPLRTMKVQAPERVLPTGQWDPPETRRRFVEGRGHTLRLLVEAPALRGHVVPHPILGPWDGYQWILAAAGHGARHHAQILEVKACPDFPAD